jgi:hypothetical protein
MQNLAATLSLIDRDQPHLSPLLTVPRETHGGMNRPIFGPRQQSAFKHLVDWVALVTNSQAAVDEAIPGDPGINVAPFDEVTMATVAEAMPPDSEKEPPTLEAEDAAAAQSPVRFGATLQFWQPKDPFDPEIFNRAQRSRAEKSNEP